MSKYILILLLLIPFSALYSGMDSTKIRGAWLTNVDSEVLKSKQNIEDAVNFCDSIGINTLFVVVWNKGMTQYPSRIMEKMTGELIDPQLKGRDPLKELITAAHKKSIKIIAWFEFGFSSSYMLNGGRLLSLHPEWAALDTAGRLVQKNGFEWMSGINPEVQDFLLSLILEVVRNYEVDGIQGDDRLPAMPVEGGYDRYTTDCYAREHNGEYPPKNFREPGWVKWRADKLNEFMRRVFHEVKAVNNNCIVSMAPSIFPWSKEEYLQDWPTWLNEGLVEMVCPQLYRYTVKEYAALLKNIVKKQIKAKDLGKFFPGILLKLGKYNATPEYIGEVVELNRKHGINGEVYFFYEGLKKYPDFFKKLYKSN